jgi:uncharacterized ParB-like nuclease family protein
MIEQRIHLYEKGPVFEIPINQVVSSINISPRSKGITTAHVMRIARTPASEYDPILVWSRTGNSYVIVDGYHRFQACNMQGARTIKAQMIYGELTNYDRMHINEQNYVPYFVRIAAYRENIPHGQHLLERERRNFIRCMVASGITDVTTLTRESQLHPEMVRWIATHEEQPKTEVTEDVEYHRKTVNFFYALGRYMHYVSSIGFSLDDAEQSAMLVSDLIEILSSLPTRKLKDVVQSLNMLGKVVGELIDRQQRGEDNE